MTVLRYKLSEEDRCKFKYYTAWDPSDKKSHRRYFYIRSFFVPLAFLFVASLSKNRQPGLNDLFALTGIGIAMSLIFSGIETFRKLIRKFHSDESNKAFLLPDGLTIDDVAVTEKDKISENMVSWNAFVKKVGTRGYFYLYLYTIHGITLPKGNLNDKEIDEFNLTQGYLILINGRNKGNIRFI